jgi:hypothetical protein
MKKKLIALTLFSALAVSGTALADDDAQALRGDDDRGWRDRDDRGDRDGDRDWRDRDDDRDHDRRDRPFLLDSAQVSGRRGTVVMSIPKTRRAGQLDLKLVSSDPDLIIRSVVLVDGRGRVSKIVPDRRDGSIDLGTARGIRSVKVTYANRGRTRNASLQLYASR